LRVQHAVNVVDFKSEDAQRGKMDGVVGKPFANQFFDGFVRLAVLQTPQMWPGNIVQVLDIVDLETLSRSADDKVRSERFTHSWIILIEAFFIP